MPKQPTYFAIEKIETGAFVKKNGTPEIFEFQEDAQTHCDILNYGEIEFAVVPVNIIGTHMLVADDEQF